MKPLRYRADHLLCTTTLAYFIYGKQGQNDCIKKKKKKEKKKAKEKKEKKKEKKKEEKERKKKEEEG